MRLTFEAAGHAFTIALNRDTPDKPETPPPGDVFANIERAETPIVADSRPPFGFCGKRTT